MRQFINTVNQSTLPEAAGAGLNYNLKAKYDEFNQRFFNGELPECKLRFGVLKGKGGICRCNINFPTPRHNPRVLKLRRLPKTYGCTMKPGSLSISISSSYERSPEAIDAILLHEMIHAWFYYKDDFDAQHGPRFLRMRADLSQKSGINIPLTDDTKDLQLSSEVGQKRVAVFIYRKAGKTSFGIVLAKAMENVKTRALEKVSWIERTRRDPTLHVSMKIVSSPFWTKKAMEIPVGRERVRSVYAIHPDELATALAEFEGEDIFEFFGEKVVQ